MKKDCLFRRYDALLTFAAALASGLLFRQGTGLHPIWYLAWIAPVPLLAVARFRSARATYVAAALAALVWESANFTYLVGVLGAPRAAMALAAKVAFWPLVILAARRGLWLYPFLCVALETLTELTSSHGSFHSLAYSQMDFLPAIQIASVLGPAGVTFLVTAFASGLALLLIHRRPFDLLFLVPVAATIGWGAWRVEHGITAPTVRVGLIGSPSASPDVLLPLVDRLAAQGAKVIVLPEKTLPGDTEILQPFILAAKQLRLALVLGINDKGSENLAVLIGPEGELARHRKVHLVPGWEKSFQPGKSTTIRALPIGLIGLAVCKDMDFPDWGRHYGRANVELMLVPAADFPGDAWLHSRISVLRGVENGFSVARAALDGKLTLSDRYGRILSEVDASEKSIAADVPVVSAPTLYPEIGSSFEFACALIFLVSFLKRTVMLSRKT